MGVFFAFLIMVLWIAHLLFCLFFAEPSPAGLWFFPHVLLQTYLYTGLFITGHDAMHGTVSRNKGLNDSIGWISTFLFAGMFFSRLKSKHHLHHATPGEDGDPDFHSGSGNFFVWWVSFMLNYLTIWQLLIMAILFNLLQIQFDRASLLWFWIIPSLLSTLQLFYFGTYLPHRRPHLAEMMPHRARSQKKGHLFALLSCYFFGYHFEHHENPGIPWWKLYQTKT